MKTSLAGAPVVIAIIVVLLLLPLSASLRAQQVTVLTVDQVRRRALDYNRDYLSAREEIRKADADVVRARAGALPDISANAYYNRNFRVPSQFVEINGQSQEFQFGFKNAFGVGLSLRQPIYQGGKVFTAWTIARLYKKYSRAGANEVQGEVIYNAEVLFYDAILKQSRLDVLNKALEANSYNLEVIEKMYDQGMVSEFEVLRARVEKNNLLPQILAAESDLKIARKRLKSFIGLELNQDVELVESEVDTTLTGLEPLEVYIDTALAARPAVRQSELLIDITDKAVRVAKGGYYPSLEAVSSWDWSSVSDEFTLDKNNTTSLTAGLQLTIPIFKGLERSGDVTQRKVENYQARLAGSQLKDDIRLEVESAYDRLIQAKKALDIQDVNIAEAQEGLKIANVRYESGVGTLLEVLSAQVALTDARNARAAALFSFREARAGLKKASTIQLSME